MPDTAKPTVSDAVDLIPSDEYAIEAEEPVITAEETKTKAQEFVEQVDDVCSKMVQNEAGEWELPEGEYSPELKYAAVSEKRRRNAQSALDKAKHAESVAQAKVKALQTRLKGKVQINLSEAEQEALDELKFSDPDAWRVKMNELETSATLDAERELADAEAEVTTTTEVDRRREVLSQFQEANPEFELNDDVIQNDLPPRIANKLKQGTVSFEDFLTEAYTYLSKGKTIVNEPLVTDKNLSKIGGKDKPSDTNVSDDIISSYEHEIF